MKNYFKHAIDAFKNLKRQKGMVLNINNKKGYGFIAPDKEDENIFFHVSNVKDATTPRIKQRVIFKIENTQKGRQAINVEAV